MKISDSVMMGLCMAGILSLSVHAQNNPAPKKIPQLTMDDLENRATVVALPASAPVPDANKTVAATNPNQKETRSISNLNARAILESAWVKMTNLKSGKIQATHRNPTEEGKSYVYEFVEPDRVRIISETGEVIAIASAIYGKQHGQQWNQIPEKSASTVPVPTYKSFSKMFVGTPAVVQLMGEENFNQVSTWKIKVEDKSGSSGFMWVGKEDGYVHQVEGTVATSGGYVKMTFSEHNVNMSILPPM
jgi:hypothetical protein